MTRSLSFQRIAVAAALVVGAVVVPVATSSTPVSAACTWCAGGEYHALPPARILDTRPATSINDVAPLGAKPLATTANTFTIDLLGLGGVPSGQGDVLAVAASITVVNPTRSGFLGAYAAGSPSVNSVINFGANQNVPNLTILRPGNNGDVTITITGSGVGSAHVLVDVFGWWSTSAYAATGTVDDGDERGARLITPATPGRILDTRQGTHLWQNSDRAVQIRGADTIGASPVIDIVPNSTNVVGVLINVTAITPSVSTFMSVVPEDTNGVAPATSNLNVQALQTKANLVLVPVGADGKIHVYNANGNAHLLIDVMGYMVTGAAEPTRAGRVVPLTSPFRAFDTRRVEFGAVPLGPGQAEDWSFANFAASVNVGGVSVGKQSALIGNLTNASLTRQYPSVGVSPSYLTACPGVCPLNGGIPSYSNVNTVEGAAVPNMALVPYGTNYAVRVFNARGYAHYILDVSAVVLAD